MTSGSEPLSHHEDESIHQQTPGARPNPNLPKPVVRNNHRGRRFAIVVSLLAAVIAGLGFTIPMRHASDTVPSTDVPDVLVGRDEFLRKHLDEMDEYRATVMELAQDPQIRTLRSRLKAGNTKAAAAALEDLDAGELWRTLSELEAPAGLAEAKADLVEGMFVRKNAVGELRMGLDSRGKSAAQEALSQFADSDTLISQGLDKIDAARQQMDDELQDAKPDPHSR